jgi:hypothetical protein
MPRADPMDVPTRSKCRKWFEEWREPSEFFRAADEGVKTFFVADKAPCQYLREAYVAGAFARIWRDDRGPCEVRLLRKGGSPDAQFKAEGLCLNLEITMALAKDKKMFEEWPEQRAKAKQGQVVLAQNCEQRQASAREAIPRVIAKKAAKHYAVPPTLLIYTDDGRALTAPELARLTMPWKDRFLAIYFLLGMDVVEAWPVLRVLRGTEPW